jgi:hypothetical protein
VSTSRFLGPPPVPPIPTRKELLRHHINIIVAVPPPPTIGYDPFFKFWQIAMRGWPIMELGPGAAEIHRNQMALHLTRDPAYRQYTHIMMLDADQRHAPSVVEQAARWVLQDRSRMVIGGLYFKKGGLHEPLFRTYSDDGEGRLSVTWEEQTLFRVNWVATGIMLVDRSVFSKIPFPYYDYVYPDVSDWKPGDNLIQRSEDTFFCRQCFDAGIPMYLDPTMRSPHIAQTLITEENYRQALRQRPELLQASRVTTRDTVYQ